MRPRLAHSFRRLVQLSFQSLHRNLLLTVATTIMMGLILFIFNVIMALNILTQNSLDELAKKVDLIVYLTEDASLYEVTQLVNEIQGNPNVVDIEYTSKDTALENFMAQYPDQSDPFTKYNLENPFPGSLRIVTSDPSQHQEVLDQITGSSYSDLMLSTESTKENQEIVERLLNVTDFTRKLILGVVISFLIGSLVMGMNAIHLSIYTRKTEIQIMQLVGARPLMIYAPFLLEGAVYSLFALMFSGVLLILFLKGTELLPYLQFESAGTPLLLAGAEALLCIFVGISASTLAVKLYLKRSLILDHA